MIKMIIFLATFNTTGLLSPQMYRIDSLSDERQKELDSKFIPF